MKITRYMLGAGPHEATRVEHAGGAVEIRMFGDKIVGHGDSAAEAAEHLADQLRTIAYLVECHEGARKDDPDPLATRNAKILRGELP